MADDARIPNVRCAKAMNAVKRLKTERREFSDAILYYRTILDSILMLIAKQSGQYLIDDYLLHF